MYEEKWVQRWWGNAPSYESSFKSHEVYKVCRGIQKLRKITLYSDIEESYKFQDLLIKTKNYFVFLYWVFGLSQLDLQRSLSTCKSLGNPVTESLE